MRRIEQWCLVAATGDVFHDTFGYPYTEPDGPNISVAGTLEGGSGWRTSNVRSCENGVITTYSGSQYELGDISQEYVEWCRKNGYHIPSNEQPVKDKFFIQDATK